MKERDDSKALSVNHEGHPISMYMNILNGFRSREIARWAKHHLSPDSYVVSDGLACFSAVTETGCQHKSIVTGGEPDYASLETVTRGNTMVENIKNVLIGTYHAINHKHLPRYLAKFCYRINRHFALERLLPRLGYIATRTLPMPVRLLRLAELHG